MNTQLSSKGQIVLPMELREADQLLPGQGRAMSMKDSLIAAKARKIQIPVATRNTKDFAFARVKIIDPFE